jgi:hypothetical protein
MACADCSAVCSLQEEESYQTSAVSVVGGALRIEARKEWSPDGSPYISGKIMSKADKYVNSL